MPDHEVYELTDVGLQSGVTLPRVELAYKTYGELDARRDNAVLMPTFYGAQHPDNEAMIGAGRASDPAGLVRYGFTLIDSGGVERLDEVFHDDVEFSMPGLHLNGIAEAKPAIAAYVTAFPDLRHEITSMIVEGTRVNVELQVTGTHSGPMVTPAGTIPASGHKLDLRSTDVIEVEDGRVRRFSVYFDSLVMAEALGVGPVAVAQRIGARVEAVLAAAKANDPRALAANYAEDAVLEHPMWGRVEGRGAVLAAEEPMFGVFHIDLAEARVVVPGPDWSAVELAFTMTHVGPMPMADGSVLPPTGRQARIEMTSVARLDANGLIVEERRHFDPSSLFSQLTAGAV